jgi:hypothetical protein
LSVTGQVASVTPRACEPVKLRPFSGIDSLSIHRPSGLFVLIADMDRGRAPGIYAAVSADLIQWSDAVLVLGADAVSESGAFNFGWPSLIDPSSRRLSFDDIGNSARLFYSRLSRKNPPYERQLVHQEVTLSIDR